MKRFRTRRLQAEDEPALNELFNDFIPQTRRGYHRSLDLMRWFLHHSPGGKADSWVIEVETSEAWQIVGHHALCPARFTFNEEDWLCAKTVNTFLLPEYRDHFLYLRFELECLRNVLTRYDATYSIGHGVARLRRALGYDPLGSWIWLERGFHAAHILLRSFANLLGRASYATRALFGRLLAHASEALNRKGPVHLVEYTSTEASSSRFFADFWMEARAKAGLAMRRDPADLRWRFWDRPGLVSSTLTFNGPGGSRGYFIVNTSDPLAFVLSDFYLIPMNPKLFDFVLNQLFLWCAQRGAFALRFCTTTNGLPSELMDVMLRNMRLFALRRFIPKLDFAQRISTLGVSCAGREVSKWMVTEALKLDTL